MRAIGITLCGAAALAGAAWFCGSGRGRAGLQPEPAVLPPSACPTAVALEVPEGAGEEERACLVKPHIRAAPAVQARAAARALCCGSGGPDWELEAQVRAAVLDAQATAELARLAAEPGREPGERLAAAELLRHLAGAELAPAALALLRESWTARESDPRHAACAVRALACFGDAHDREALLDASAAASGIALAGLSAARGDAAALELAGAARAGGDTRRSETALAALAVIASSPEGGLSPRARAQCAAALEATFADAREARRLCALAALDPARSAPR